MLIQYFDSPETAALFGFPPAFVPVVASRVQGAYLGPVSERWWDLVRD